MRNIGQVMMLISVIFATLGCGEKETQVSRTEAIDSSESTLDNGVVSGNSLALTIAPVRCTQEGNDTSYYTYIDVSNPSPITKVVQFDGFPQQVGPYWTITNVCAAARSRLDDYLKSYINYRNAAQQVNRNSFAYQCLHNNKPSIDPKRGWFITHKQKVTLKYDVLGRSYYSCEKGAHIKCCERVEIVTSPTPTPTSAAAP